MPPTTIQTWAALARPEDLEHSNLLLQAHLAGQTTGCE